jgi:hypothetical protein
MIFADYPGHWWATAAAAVIILLPVAIWFRNRLVGMVRSVLLVAAAIMLVAIVWNPSAAVLTPVRARPVGAVFIDTSSSMAGRCGGGTRLDAAVQAFRRISQANPSFSWRVYGFDEAVYFLDDVNSIRCRRQQMQFDMLHEFLCRNFGGQLTVEPVSTAIVLTDGQAETDSSEYRQAFGKKAVWVVDVRDGRTYPEIRIESVYVPEMIAVNAEAGVKVLAKCRNYKGTLTAALLESGEIMGLKNVHADSNSVIELNFNVIPAKPGFHEYSVQLGHKAGETETLDDTKVFYIQAVGPRKIAVLHYCQALNFQTRAIRRVLQSYLNVRVDSIFDVRTDAAWSKQLPDDANQLDAYSLIILDRVDFGKLTQKQTVALQEFVHRGGGLVFLPGPEDFSTLQDAKIKTLLPVVCLPEMQAEISAETVLTDYGREFFAEGSDIAVVEPATAGVRAKASSTILMRRGPVPVVCMQQYGLGTTCLLNTANLYEVYQNDERYSALYKFVRDLLMRTARGNLRDYSIAVQLLPLREYGKAVYKAFITDSNDYRLHGGGVLADIDGKVYDLHESSPGVYGAIISTGEKESIKSRVVVQKNGQVLAEAQKITAAPGLKCETGMGDGTEFLKEYCKRTGAHYTDLNSAAENIGKLPGEAAAQEVTVLGSAWRRLWIFGIICVLLCGNWLIGRMWKGNAA